MDYKKIGDCELYLGDCAEVMPRAGKADIALFDPPYKMEIHGRGFAAKRDYYKKLDYGTATDFVLSDEFYNQLLSQLSETNLFIFCNKLMKLDIENWAVGKKFNFDEIILRKTAPAPLTNNQWLPDKEFGVHIFKTLAVRGDYKTKNTVFEMPNFKDESIDHPSPKPIWILEKIIKNISEPEQTIIDPFMGSGSTLLAAAKQGRKAIGIEINPKYFEIACDRLTAFYEQNDMFNPP